MANPSAGAARRVRAESYLFFFVLFAAVIFLTHIPVLKLPYFWDELGQYVPAALDLYRTGSWIPHSTTPNVHPPGVVAYLAAFWSLTDYAVPATRIAMLLLASAGMLAVFLLAIRTCAATEGAPAFLVAALMLFSPLFYTQAMLAQLDMPAMLLTCLALLLFLEDRHAAAAAACTALVLVKETGLLVPLVLAAWLVAEKRLRAAAYFLAPALALAGWLIFLKLGTGHWLGSAAFAEYNALYLLHPVRFLAALGRRLYFLCCADFHWIGTAAVLLALRKSAVFASRAWGVVGVLIAAHVLTLSLFGGAMLERYLLPVLPLAYMAMVAAIAALPPGWKIASQLALTLGVLSGNFWNPPYPAPLENNLALTDFVKLQQSAAEFVEINYAGRSILTAWPLGQALASPDWGYVHGPLQVRPIPDFRPSTLAAADWSGIGVFVLYSRGWEPAFDLLANDLVRRFWHRFYGYEREAAVPGARRKASLERVAHWSRRGQWIDVYAVAPGGKDYFLINGAFPAPPN